ncbi:MAG: zinc-binding dehydrogenase [Pseudonocardiaceae bacterium]
MEPLACVLNNPRCADPRPDDQIAIIGAGPIGTLCAHVLIAQGSQVSVVEGDAVRARLARDILAPALRHSSALAKDLGGCDRPDVVIDTTGVLLEQALEVVECGGTVVVMGEREGARASLALRSSSRTSSTSTRWSPTLCRWIATLRHSPCSAWRRPLIQSPGDIRP